MQLRQLEAAVGELAVRLWLRREEGRKGSAGPDVGKGGNIHWLSLSESYTPNVHVAPLLPLPGGRSGLLPTHLEGSGLPQSTGAARGLHGPMPFP